jgi:hypothetical protein
LKNTAQILVAFHDVRWAVSSADFSTPCSIQDCHHFSTPPWANTPFQFPRVVPAGASLHASQCHYFSFNIQHSKLLIIFELSVSSLNNCLQPSFSKSDMNVAISILWKGCYAKYLRWCSIRYSPSTWNLHDEHSTTVLDVESRITLQKTTGVNDIGRLKEQALNFHGYASMDKMERHNANKCCFLS